MPNGNHAINNRREGSKTIALEIPAGQPDARLLEALADLKAGDRALLAVAHTEGNRLALLEVLKRSGSL